MHDNNNNNFCFAFRYSREEQSIFLTRTQTLIIIIHESAVSILHGVSQSVPSPLVRCVGLASDWLAAAQVREALAEISGGFVVGTSAVENL